MRPDRGARSRRTYGRSGPDQPAARPLAPVRLYRTSGENYFTQTNELPEVNARAASFNGGSALSARIPTDLTID